MNEENSWIRRTKFSHTIYHRLDPARLTPTPLPIRSGQVIYHRLDPARLTPTPLPIRSGQVIYHRLDPARLTPTPLPIRSGQVSGLKSRPGTGAVADQQGSSITQIQKSAAISNKFRSVSPIPQTNFSQQILSPRTNKLRAVSPIPQTKLSQTFKEARSDQKRFSTPNPVRKEVDKGVWTKLLLKDSSEKRAHVSKSHANIGLLKHFTPTKFDAKTKKKELTWTKYFDHAGGRVTAIDSVDEWMVDLSMLFIGLKFDHGANSQLYHGIYKDEPVAVKIIRVPDDDENGDLGARLEKQFTREVTLLSRLHHQNVIKFVAACRKPSVFSVITEYLSNGSLRTYLRKLEQALSLKKLISIALDIARGMEFIHSQGVIHRDLKPENILINQDFQLKIADFGIACEEANCDSMTDDPGTYRWMAPEMLKRKTYGRKVDIYSFGLILLEMVTGSIPFKDMTPSQAAFAVLNKNLRPTIPGDCPSPLRVLIEQCWSVQPDRRPEFRQVVKVLEQFESSLACDGTLNLVQNPTLEDQKGRLHRIQKLGPTHQKPLSMPKPKFA